MEFVTETCYEYYEDQDSGAFESDPEGGKLDSLPLVLTEKEFEALPSGDRKHYRKTTLIRGPRISVPPPYPLPEYSPEGLHESSDSGRAA